MQDGQKFQFSYDSIYVFVKSQEQQTSKNEQLLKK